MKRVIAGIVLFVLLAGAGVFYFARNDIALALFRSAAQRGLANDLVPTLPDGLTAGFCGTGSPLPDRTRAGPCTAVVAGGASVRVRRW